MKRTPEHTAARRAVARLHHPDVGGDPRLYASELAAVDRRFAGVTATSARSTNARSTGTNAVRRHLRTALRSLTRLRRRRYFDI